MLSLLVHIYIPTDIRSIHMYTQIRQRLSHYFCAELVC